MGILTPVYAATLRVCPSGCTYSSIQTAVNAAGSGDTIEIQGGTYSENVDFGNTIAQLTLMGAFNSTFTSRNTTGNPTIVSYFRLNPFHSGTVTADGIWVVGSTSQGVTVSSTSSSLVLRNCSVHDSASYGVYAYYVNNITIENCTFYNNGSYGGVSVGSFGLTGQAIVRNNTMHDNGCAYCWGLSLENVNSNDLVENNTIYENTNGLYAKTTAGQAPQILNNRVYSNNGTGIEVWNGNTVISGNLSFKNFEDGLIYSNPGSPSILSNTFAENGNVGLHLYGNSGSPSIVNNIVSGNNAHGISISGSLHSWNGTAILPSALRFNILSLNGASAFLHNSLPPAYGYGSEIPGDYSDFNQFAWSEGNMRFDPEFKDPTANDYTLDSTSFAINEGDPTLDYSLEPANNGSRINLGFEGNTSLATTSPNAPTISNVGVTVNGNDLDISFNSSAFTSIYWLTLAYWDGDSFESINPAQVTGTDYQEGYKTGRISSGNSKLVTWTDGLLTVSENSTKVRVTLEHGQSSVSAESSVIILRTPTPTPTNTAISTSTPTPTPTPTSTPTTIVESPPVFVPSTTPTPTLVATQPPAFTFTPTQPPSATSTPAAPIAPTLSLVRTKIVRNRLKDMWIRVSDMDSVKLSISLTIHFKNGQKSTVTRRNVSGVSGSPKQIRMSFANLSLKGDERSFCVQASDTQNNLSRKACGRFR